MTIHAFSYGGGVQSTAALVLAVQDKIPPRLFIFANVGEDSEHPATLAYVDEVAKPYAAAHGIELVEVRHQSRKHGAETLLGRVERTPRSLVIPVRLSNGAPSHRNCTSDFKIIPITQELKRRGATADDPAISYLGISIDEWQRMRTDSGIPWQRLVYPLVDMGLTRADCALIIQEAGLPVPPKSSCYFCPFHTLANWRHLRDATPDLFAKAVALEELLTARMEGLGQGPIYFTRQLKSLTVIADEPRQADMFADNPAAQAEIKMLKLYAEAEKVVANPDKYPAQVVIMARALIDEMGGNEEDTCESGYCMV